MKWKGVFSAIAGVIIIVILSFVVWRFFVSSEDGIYKQTRFVMHTYCTIQAYGSKKEANRAISLALDRIEEIDRKFNFRNPGTPLYKLNNTGTPVTDGEILDVVNEALSVSKITDGAFDITVYPLLRLWGFSGASQSLPARSKILGALGKMGYKNLILKDNKLRKTRDYISVDLGGIAKGYAIGEAVKVLKREGIEAALVDGGGDLYALGKLEGRPWKVGIRNPRGKGVIGVIEISDLSVVTSGDYERFFMKDGVRYHHIIDPKTGYPAKGLASVTVFTWNPVVADAWATALFVMGEKRGFALAEKTPDIETLMITTEGKVLISSGLKENLEIDRVEK